MFIFKLPTEYELEYAMSNELEDYQLWFSTVGGDEIMGYASFESYDDDSDLIFEDKKFGVFVRNADKNQFYFQTWYECYDISFDDYKDVIQGIPTLLKTPFSSVYL